MSQAPQPWPGAAENARLGEAPPASESIPVRAQPGEVLPVVDWPDACAFLDEDDITAVLPDATEIDEEPGSVSTRSVEDYAADPAHRSETFANHRRCVWSMKLPGERPTHSTSVWMRIIAAGDPELVSGYHEDQELGRGAWHPFALGDGGSCYLTSMSAASLVCAQGPLMFEVGGFTTAGFGDDGDLPAYASWRDEVLGEFASAIAGKVRSG